MPPRTRPGKGTARPKPSSKRRPQGHGNAARKGKGRARDKGKARADPEPTEDHQPSGGKAPLPGGSERYNLRSRGRLTETVVGPKRRRAQPVGASGTGAPKATSTSRRKFQDSTLDPERSEDAHSVDRRSEQAPVGYKSRH